MGQSRTTLVVPDLHCPFAHKDAVHFLADLKKRYSPTTVVVIGDEIDGYALSRFDKDPEAMSVPEELKAARAQLAKLYRLFPEAKVCWGNHTARLYRKASGAGIPAAMVRPIRSVLGAPPGWSWRDSWALDGVRYEHGDGFRGEQDLAIKAARQNRCNTVLGHFHTVAGAQFGRDRRGPLWGLAVGCLVDEKALAFHYSRASPRRPVLGAGVVVDGVPRFVPMG